MDEADIRACATRFGIRLPRARPRGVAGERLGSGTGSSLEFQDFRPYVPGDDPRHVDWAAYARSDELFVRLYREEVTPHVDLILDVSASMAVTREKERRARELIRVFAEIASLDRLTMSAWCVGEDGPRLERDARSLAERVVYGSRGGLDRLADEPPRLRRNGVRIAVSDLLFAVDPRPLIRVLAEGAAALSVVQLLDGEELEPTVSGGTRLVDVETEESLDLVVSEQAIREYRRRLVAHQDAWRVALRRGGGTLAVCSASATLDELARGPLREARILGVRGVEIAT